MATIVQGNANDVDTLNQTSFSTGFAGAPTAGNLLVLYYGARDSDNSETPTFTMPSGWVKVAEASPMEFHTVGIAWRTSDGSESGTITVTPGAGVRSSWIGLVEFNQSGVSSWQLDKASANGSGATNVSNIASGSTGTLGSAVGVAAIAGTSRTGAEALSTDTGTSLSSVHGDFEVDAGTANYIGAWLSLTATTALNATITEASGASRMGAAIATFIEAGGAAAFTGTTATTQDAQTSTASGTVEAPAFTGTATPSQDAQTATASGTVVPPAFTGTTAVTQADQTSTAAGLLGAAFPDAPSGVTAAAQSDTEILVSWNAVVGADAYDVERDSVIVGSKITLTSFSDTGLSPSTQYSYRVRAARTP